MSQRFYCPEPPVDGVYRLDADETRHLTRVCRKDVGSVVELFDGRGFATAARVVGVGKDGARLSAEGPPLPERSAPCRIEVGAAVPKGDRFDWLVEKAVEVGVDRLVPVAAERSVVDPRGSKLDRLRKTVVEASKQSARSRLMDLADSEGIEAYLARPEAIRLVADPSGLTPDAWPAISAGASVRLLVGPEGGLTYEEIALAKDLGWTPIRFAASILRVETAVVAGAAAILARCQPPVH